MKQLALKLALVWVIAAVLAPWAVAQEKDDITLTTNPAGAIVYLSGEYELVANTPARLPSNISGRYKARITRPGYEQWKGELTFVPGGANNIDVKLSKKTRFKAGLRSLFIPGWGQFYAGSSTRGAFFTAGVLVSGIAVYVTDRHYQKKRSDFDIANQQYRAATSIEDRTHLQVIRDQRQRAAYQAETDRRTAFAIGAALWAYNFIDAFVFFPESEVFFPTVTAIDDGAQLTFTARF